MCHVSPGFFIAYQIIASTTRHWLFLHVARTVFPARTFIYLFLHWTIEKEYSLCPNCQPPLASGESRFPFGWHLLYAREITSGTGHRNGLLVRALTATGSREKQWLETDLLHFWWMLNKYEKSAPEVVHSNLSANFKYLFHSLSGWLKSLWLKFPPLVSPKTGFEGRNICENDLQMS